MAHASKGKQVGERGELMDVRDFTDDRGALLSACGKSECVRDRWSLAWTSDGAVHRRWV